MDDAQKLREQAWATLKQMHDDLSKPKEPELVAANGWCSPSSVIYGPAWQPGPYCGTTSYQIKNAAGEVVFSYP